MRMLYDVRRFLKGIPNRRLFYTYSIIYMFLCLFERLFSFFSFYLLGDISNPNRPIRTVLLLLLLIILVETASQVTAYIVGLCEVKLIAKTEKELAAKATAALLNGKPAYVQSQSLSSANIVSRLQNDLPQYTGFIGNISNFIIVLPASIAIAVIALATEWRLCVLSMVICIAQQYLSKWLQKRRALLSKEKKEQFTEGISVMLDAVHALLSMRWMLSLKDRIIARHDESSRKIYSADTREKDIGTQISIAGTVASILGDFCFLMVGAFLVMQNFTSFGIFLAIYSVRNSLLDVFNIYGDFRGAYMNFKVNEERLQVFWDIETETETSLAKTRSTKIIAKSNTKNPPALAFSDISFEYKKDTPVLSNLSFALKQNEILRMGGVSGSGKSTVFSLIQGFLNVDKGEISFFGSPSDTLPISQQRAMVYCFSQRFYLFNTTIAENIRFGRLEAKQEAIEKAAKLAQIDSYIASLPDGYNTVLRDNGSTLSAGQRQRMMIARALLSERPIWLLDEITASLDAQTGEELETALLPLLNERSVLFSSHKESGIILEDRRISL